MARYCFTFLSAACLLLLPATARAIDWPVPTPEELHMTAPAQDPGANAVYLSFDEEDDDHMNVHTVTVRLKLFTDAAVKRYSDIEVGVTPRHFAIGSIEAQTVHADGSVVPFTGKAFVKSIHHNGETYKATVFSMPDVQPGSIIEYRYRLSYDDNQLLPAQWFLQHDAYALHEHYKFIPFDLNGSKYVILDHGQTSSGLVYVKALPPGAKLEEPNAGGHPFYELTASEVPAESTEDYLPPMHSISYRLQFYYAAQLNVQDYWKSQGKYFSKDINSFASPGAKLRSDVATLVAPSDTPEMKARKLYAAAMKIENSSYLRQHSAEEDRAVGLHPIHSAEDIWERQRGNDDQIAMTYLAMLRLAGIEAYAMRVTDRDRDIFLENYISTSQLDDVIVIAMLNGKEVYLDPGALYCPFGQLAWRHSWTGGIRQTKDGSVIAQSGGLDYKDSFDQRVAVLQLDADGTAGGVVTLKYTGQTALGIRQREAGEAAADTKQRLEESLRAMLPAGVKLHVLSMENLTDGEKPLVLTFAVNGPFVTTTGHRFLLSEAPFRTDEHALFTSPTRKNPVYFHYPSSSTDFVQIRMAPGLKIEELPKAQSLTALNSFSYTMQAATSTENVLQIKRTTALGTIIVSQADYAKMRDYYSSLQAADGNQILITRVPDAAKGSATGAAQ